ncbi:MAG: NAD(P)H-hydrate dehydratase, partial [Kiloniellales bacterium]|nr:NAD(P)H-hydrate dehydratase [Kiloniellales bacterium]
MFQFRLQHVVLTPEETREADRLAIEAGISGIDLMEAAGRAVAQTVCANESPREVLVLCGPGNNGGDGFVAARYLRDRGWHVRVATLGELSKLKGDAAYHAGLWKGKVESLNPRAIKPGLVLIDALFGAGLCRPLAGDLPNIVEASKNIELPVYAVDVPSGVSGADGSVLGEHAFNAKKTVTFQTLKPGHLLYPGRQHCGETVVADIGIPERVIEDLAPKLYANDPALWLDAIPKRRPQSHKYNFGHALVVSGPKIAGATILAAEGALRVGAGLVTLAASPRIWQIQAAALPSAICRALRSEQDYLDLLGDHRINSLLIGPGAGAGDETRKRVIQALRAKKSVVLDADAITAFATDPDHLFQELRGCVAVLTPHEGEFRRLFPDLKGDRLSRARAAAHRAGAHIVLKGADTIVASPDGFAVISNNAPPWLATAGAGDVLAGLIVGLLAQGMTAAEAGSAAVWLHGAAASRFGPGMIAEDLPKG